MNTIRLALTTGALTLVAAPAFAQTDDCAAPTAINTTGSFAYDTSANTASGVTPCGPNFNTDTFWVWTCPADDTYVFDTCGTTYDTRLGVYAGTDCSATCLVDNDDACGLQSSVTVAGMLAGDTIVVHVGGFGAGNIGPGVMNINAFIDLCVGNPDDGLEENDTCVTAGAGPALGFTPALYCSVSDPDFYTYAVAAGDILDFSFIETDTSVDLDLRLWDSACTLIQFFNTDALSYSSPIAQTLIVEVFVDPGFPGTGCTLYDTTVSIAPDPCIGTMPDALEENDTCAAALPMSDGTSIGLSVFKSDWDYYYVSVADQGTLTADIFFSHANGDLDIFLYDATTADCNTNENVQTHGTAGSLVNGFSLSDNESITWTNTTGACADYIIEVNVWGATPSNCNTYDLVIGGTGCGGGPTIVVACDPANNHTQGNYTKLDTSDGSGPGVLHLEATDGPNGEFGYFLVSAILNDPGAGVSNGMLCLGAPIGRYAPAAGGAFNSIGQFDGAGVFQNLAGTSTAGSGYDVLATLPTPPGGTIGSGDTWYFQCWYRDGQRSNFSNVICVTF